MAPHGDAPESVYLRNNLITGIYADWTMKILDMKGHSLWIMYTSGIYQLSIK